MNLKVLTLVCAVLVLAAFKVNAQVRPTLQRVWFDEYESACMAQMSTGEIGEVKAATWFRVAAARENNALSSFYAILAQFAKERKKQGEFGIFQHNQNGWSCKTGVVVADLLQKTNIPVTRRNLLAVIRMLESRYPDPTVIQNYRLPDPMLVLPLRLTEPQDEQGYLKASKALERFIELTSPMLTSQEDSKPLGGLPAVMIAPPMNDISIRSGGAEFYSDKILQLWRNRQRIIGAGIWRDSVPGFIYFKDDQGVVYVAGTDALQNFNIVSLNAPKLKAKYEELYKKIKAEGFVGENIYKEAESRMASVDPAFGIIMVHVNVHDAWQYINFFMDVGRKTLTLKELSDSVKAKLQELD